MENIFTELNLHYEYFNHKSLNNLKLDLWFYLFDNLQKENNILRWDLQIALKINANGEYI